jgi:hypothetical protein
MANTKGVKKNGNGSELKKLVSKRKEERKKKKEKR